MRAACARRRKTSTSRCWSAWRAASPRDARAARLRRPRRRALGALKPAEDGDGLILRVYEPAGARGRFALRLPEGWRDAGAVDLLEQPSAPQAEGWLSPFEVRSWRLRRG